MISTTVWPASWNSLSFWRTTVWPRWTSAAVGSRPSLTRSGRSSASRRSSAPAGRHSTALRARGAGVRAAAVADDDTPAVVPLRPEYAESVDGGPSVAVRIRKLRVLGLLAGLGLLAA